MLALVLTMVVLGGLAWPVLGLRLRRLSELSSSDRERTAGAYWAARRACDAGLSEAGLQEEVCRLAHCTPAEADAAIARVVGVEPQTQPR